MKKKFIMFGAPVVGLIILSAIALAVFGPTRLVTTPEQAFAKHLQAVDAALLSGGRNTSALSGQVPKAADVGAKIAAQAQLIAAYEQSKAVGFGKWVASHSDTYKSITSILTTRSVNVTDARATIVGNVVTTMLWSSTATPKMAVDPRKALDVQKAKKAGRAFGPGDIITSSVSAEHTVTLALVNGSWYVVSDVYLDPFTDRVTKP